MFEQRRERKLLEIVEQYPHTNSEMINVIQDSAITESIILEIIRKNSHSDILIAALNSPVLTEKIHNTIFDITLNEYKYSTYNTPSKVCVELLKSKFLTGEQYKTILDSYYDIEIVAKELVKSKYASEEVCLKIIRDACSGFACPQVKIVEAVMSSPYMSSTILEEIIRRAFEKEIFEMCIDSPYLTADQFKNILNTMIREGYMTSDLSIKIFANKYMTSDMIIDLIKHDGYYESHILPNIFVSPQCTKEVLLLSLNYPFSRNCLNKIINHSSADTEVIMEVLKKMNTDNIMSDYEKEEIFKEILNSPHCSNEIVMEILKGHPEGEVYDIIKCLPNMNSKEMKLALMVSKRNIDTEDIDEILALDGLTDEDYITLIDMLNKILIIRKILEKDKLGTKVYLRIIEEFENLSYYHENEIKGFALKILERDVPEVVLCELAKNVDSLEVIRKIGAHKNAGTNVATTLKVIAENNCSNERASEEVYKIAEEVKQRVLKGMFTIEEENDVTEILRANIEDGLSTMLWGPSGVGKSSRVFEIDPTTTLLILKNGMLPEEVIGGKEPNGEPGEIYPPHWYVVLCEKCKAEPDRKHVLFIDEFTNVSDTIKNLVWEVIGNRLVNGHEEWPLPENCSIVVAGNRLEESSAVRVSSDGTVMPQPLHNRIDSHLEIIFDIDEWQRWALETNPKTGKLKIHPIVYSFCVAHADDVMFTSYNSEDVTEPFLTPRKWETLSKAIYKVEERGEMHHISNARIKSIIGNNAIAEAFIAHYERLPLDMSKIESGEYMPEDFMSIEDKLYALGMAIAKYEGDEMAIESFIVECLGEEYYSIYNSMKGLKESIKEQEKGL